MKFKIPLSLSSRGFCVRFTKCSRQCLSKALGYPGAKTSSASEILYFAVGLRSSVVWPLRDGAYIHLLRDCCRFHVWLSKSKASESLRILCFGIVSVCPCQFVDTVGCVPLLQLPLPQQDPFQGIKGQCFLLKVPACILSPISTPLLF